jgi:predicted HicB family RNase H-like nuclease
VSRTVSARISKEMHESLRDKCNDLGCSINDYIVDCIELVLEGSTEFDFGD